MYLFTNQKGFTGFNDVRDIQIGDETKLVQLDVVIPGEHKKSFLPEDSMCLRMKAMTYLKNKGYDVVVYMDADAIMLKEFPELFWIQKNGMVEDNLIRAYNKTPIKVNRLRKGHMKRHIYELGFRYFNSGMIRADLHSEAWANTFEDYLAYRLDPVTHEGQCLDQDFLNYKFKEDWMMLPLSYNMHLWNSGKYNKFADEWISKTETAEHYANEINSIIIHHVYVLHYAAENKPWDKPNIRKKNRWMLNLPHFWTAVARDTEYLSEKTIDRVNEIDEFIKIYKYRLIAGNDIPTCNQLAGLTKIGNTLSNFL